MKKRVFIGLSGGIDSAAGAYLLKEQGYDVLGVTFDFFNDEQLLKKAEKVSKILGISHEVIDARQRFEKRVLDPFVKGYKEGKTPNPCMLCNLHLKFNLLMTMTKEKTLIATGHYATIIKIGNHFALYAAKNPEKDQSYFLYHLNQEILSRLLLPLNQFSSKAAVKECMKNLMPEIAKGSESQGICFIPHGNHTLFLKERIYGINPVRPGNIVDTEGKILGRHHGVLGFTYGQTRKLGIENKKGLAVIEVKPKTNTIVLGEAEKLFQKKIRIESLKKIDPKENLSGKKWTFKICRWGNLYTGEVKELNFDEAEILSKESVRAATPGQTLVFYEGSRVVAGGIIK